MDWLIFADDWAAHPSTTQHLAKHLPAEDNIVWVNSIGMRAPRFCRPDLWRFINKAKSILLSGMKSPDKKKTKPPDNMLVVNAPMLPWHQNRSVRKANQPLFDRTIKKALAQKGLQENQLVILAANPVTVLYLQQLFPKTPIGYLRLDDYRHLPGVDSSLAGISEDQMFKQASVVFATARALMPEDQNIRSVYLPQGVDWQHFAQIPSQIPGDKILGFHGLMAEWIDFDLIRSTAELLPDWTFEFVGPVRSIPDWFENDHKNIRLLPAVDYQELPKTLTRWDAAWIPFCVNTLTKSVNPLKLREYLAAGLPTLCTPLPEAKALDVPIEIVSDPNQVAKSLSKIHKQDNRTEREKRKKSVSDQDWSHRSTQLRNIMQEILKSRF